MQVSYFKTYSSKKVKQAVRKIQLNTLNENALLNHRLQAKEKEAPTKFELTPELKKRLSQNRKKLGRKSKASKVALKSEWVRALFPEQESSQIISESTTATLEKLPLKPKQQHNLKQDRELLVLKYQGNCKDPYYQLRNVSHISYIQ